jgi:hypothetical protein
MLRAMIAVVTLCVSAGCQTATEPNYAGPGHRNCALPGSYCSQVWR